MEYLSKIFAQFPLNGDVLSCERYGHGHINVTYLVVTNSGCRYILQKINHKVFPNVDGLMRNMVAVTNYLREKVSDPRGVLPLMSTKDGAGYLHHTDGTFWRVLGFIENGLCLQAPETPEDFYESAVAFGNFQQQRHTGGVGISRMLCRRSCRKIPQQRHHKHQRQRHHQTRLPQRKARSKGRKLIFS